MNNNPLKLIADNYNDLNAMMVKEIELATAHPGLTGSYREEMWRKLFRSMIPLKFSFVHGAMIIDSDGGISNEVDIAVIDEQYTPYIFQYHNLKLIPIEAVSMVIECKSTSLPEEQLIEWAKSIDDLNAKNTGIARMATGYSIGVTNITQSKTRPIKVLVSIKESTKDVTIEALKERLGDHFDFIVQEQVNVVAQNKLFQLLVKHEDKTLGWWGKRLNEHKDVEQLKDFEKDPLPLLGYVKESGVKELNDSGLEVISVAAVNPDAKSITSTITNTLEDLVIQGNPLLTLNLQLNQLLMLMNNPMLFPHFAYAKAFNKLNEKQDIQNP
ncbi:DUF6602 domain-containing protein [Paenibacillus pabuli]|uniref:DUF6602 domain-containing protein n=1 Tax=Paenibacillus pabuli TaxID=1472 RepID=UPI001FFF446C|nr:DUF6602 domain-containing protein [Paenibacillus pabuli]UPK44999.1 hypothetical protein KET34_05715 [Paenibacillus pabuli]